MYLTVVLSIILCVLLIQPCSSTTTTRALGGTLAKPKQIPYIVHVSNNGKVEKTWCSATIVTPRWVISAAHCYRKLFRDNMTLMAGLVDHNHVTSHTQVRRSIKHVMHDLDPRLQRVPEMFNADIILIETCKPFKFNEYVGPIRIAKKPYPHPKKVYCTMVGFGRTDANGALIHTSLEAMEAYIGGDPDNCRKMNNFTGWTASHLCVDLEVPGSAGCSGDSGGPLVCEGLMTGVLSGRGSRDTSVKEVLCGREGNYHIFMFVGFFEPWIRKHIPDLPQSEALIGDKKVWLKDVSDSGTRLPTGCLPSIILASNFISWKFKSS